MNMLDKKFKHNKLKPQAHKEPKYTEYLHENKQPPCFVCNIQVGIQMHHVKEHSNDLRNDNEQIPLCYNHHKGTEFSAHETPTAFREAYPIELQLAYAKTLYKEYKNG